MSTEGELWHIVEAMRDDGTPTMFRIRELEPRTQLDTIFVVELPYPATELSRLPNAAAYRRLAELDENWVRPACISLGWEYVASKTEDGSFFLYMYGTGDATQLVSRLSPFDAGLGFYDDPDPDWLEYGTLRELLDKAKALKQTVKPAATTKSATRATPGTPRKRAGAKRAATKRTTATSAAKRRPQPRKAATKAAKPAKPSKRKRAQARRR